MLPISRVPVARGLLLVGVVVLVGALAVAVQGRWSGPDSREQQERLADEMEQHRRAVIMRLERKERVIEAFLAGRLTLLEAAAYFRALDQGPPEFHWEHFRLYVPGATDEERHCNEVIDVAFCVERSISLAEAEQLRDCLRDELREHMQRGPLQLPELPRPLTSLDGEQN
jgi:hypothetical protein